MYTTGTTLKYFKRLNIYKNSTSSCTFNPETNEGYSYEEQIVKPIENDTIKLFNNYNFSVTTSCHQSTLRCFYREIDLKGLNVDLPSINNIENIDDLTKDILNNIELDNSYTLKLIRPDLMPYYTELREKYITEKKLKKKMDRIYYKIRKFDYHPKNIVRKIKDYLKYDSYMGFIAKIDDSQVDSFLKVVEAINNGELDDLNIRSKVTEYSGFNLDSAEKLYNLKEIGFTVSIPNALLEEIEKKNKLKTLFEA